MTPTLTGRLTTRVLLYILVAYPVTLIYGLYLADLSWPPAPVPFHVINTMMVIGLLADPIYILIQHARWDQDWPFAYQFIAMCAEFLLACAVIDTGWLEPSIGPVVLNAWTASWHFFWVLLASFGALLAGFQIIYLRWRYKGGEAGRFPTGT